MSAEKTTLVFGFSNGVLIVYDTDKNEVTYTNKALTQEKAPIDRLKLARFGKETSVVFLLSEGLLSYLSFPRFTDIDVLAETGIVDFDFYSAHDGDFLATLHESELKLFRLNDLEFR